MTRSDIRPAARRRAAAGYRRGWSIRQLAAEVGVAYGTMRKWLIEDGVSLRKPGVRTQKEK